MPTVYDLKPRFQAALRPLVRRLAAAGVTANQVTVAAGAASAMLGAALAIEHRGWTLLPVFLFVRMALNAMDGMLAREHGQASKMGAVLNEVMDLISDAALTLPFATLPGWNFWLVAGAMVFAALTEIAGMAGPARRYDGPFGKSDRALALGVMGLWLALGWPVSPMVRQMAPPVWIVLCCATIYQRIRRAFV